MKKHRKTSKKRVIKSNKKAQFFIMAGIIIILVLYTLTINYNWVKETLDLEQLSNFEEKSEAYNKESVKVVNYKIYTAPVECLDTDTAITNPDCPPKALADFSSEFVKYAKQSDPNYGLIFMYKMPDGSIIIKNMLGGWLDKDAGTPQTLKIIAKTGGLNSQQIPIDEVLLSTQDKSTGSIDLNIGGQQFSTSVQTDTSNFGQGLSQSTIIDAKEIIIETESMGRITIPLTDQTLLTSTQTYFGEGNTKVDVTLS